MTTPKGIPVFIIIDKKIVFEADADEPPNGLAFTHEELAERDRAIWNAARASAYGGEVELRQEGGLGDKWDFASFEEYERGRGTK